jgi:ERCC4-type nuclease
MSGSKPTQSDGRLTNIGGSGVSYPVIPKRRLTIWIDYRERELFAAVRARMALFYPLEINEVVMQENLPVADVLWAIKGDSSDLFGFLVERKAAADLRASIIDGRHREQKGRFFNLGLENGKIMYIYEGNLTVPGHGACVKACIGASVKTIMRDGFKIGKTDNIEGTADYLMHMHLYLEYLDAKEVEARQFHYSDYLQAGANKKDIQGAVAFEHMLINIIQGISAAFARAIVAKYPDPATLVNAYIRAGKEQAPLLLAKIRVQTDTRERNVGPAVSKNVATFFNTDALDYPTNTNANANASGASSPRKPRAPTAAAAKRKRNKAVAQQEVVNRRIPVFHDSDDDEPVVSNENNTGLASDYHDPITDSDNDSDRHA